MSRLSREALDALFTAVNTSLNAGLAKAWTGWQSWSNVIPSGGAGEKYPMMLVTGGMRKWVGDRVIHKLSGKTLTVRNEDFEHTEGVDRNDIEDDAIGFYAPLFEAMGIDAGNHWGRLATAALLEPGNWADGKPFFSKSRKLGKGTYTNTVDGALSAETYEAARALMMGFTDATEQNPLGLLPDTLMVGSQSEKIGKKLLQAELVVESGAAVDNLNRGTATLQVNPYIPGGQWFLLCTTRGIQAVSVQKRKEGALQRWDSDSDTCVKEKNENHYGLHYRGAAAGTCPFVVVGGNLG